MIIWLASYPRSGNTLTRILLHRHFGMTTWSVHGDGNPRDIGADLSAVVGFTPHGPLDAATLAAMAESPETFIVKTHNLPPPDSDFPAICVLRDGRSALTSYWHYRNRPGDVAPSLAAVVAGAVQFGSWSAHAAAWIDAPLSRRLILRYEDLAVAAPQSLAAIADFIGRAPAEAPAQDFAELHAKAPSHFRAGSDARNVAELEACCPALFNALHGAVQSRLGYPLASVAGDSAAALAAELAPLFAAALDRARLEAERDALRGDVAGLAAAAEARAQEAAEAQAKAAALDTQVAALGAQVAAMRNSPFWRLRDTLVGMLRSAGLRQRD